MHFREIKGKERSYTPATAYLLLPAQECLLVVLSSVIGAVFQDKYIRHFLPNRPAFAESGLLYSPQGL